MSVELSRRWINGAYRYTASEGDRLNYALVEVRGGVANTEGVSIAVLPENTVIMLSAFSIVEAFDQPAAIHRPMTTIARLVSISSPRTSVRPVEALGRRRRRPGTPTSIGLCRKSISWS
jgi:hypothetical protein